MGATAAATGFRTWLQTHRFGWLTPKRLRALTIAAMSAAAIVSTIGFSGSTPPQSHQPATASTHAQPAQR